AQEARPAAAPAAKPAAAPEAKPAPGPAPAAPGAKPAAAPVTRISSGSASAAAAAVTITYIEFNPEGRDVEGEYVLIRNASAEPMNMTGWKLHDGAQRHTYVFPQFVLAPGAEVKLWTRAGTNDAANLYWGQRVAVWNNEGDTGTLLDASGAVVSRYTYTGERGKGRK
ncbi:MAG: lamin tail domain-containing protein, partial [Chloroflexaceae bacterium]|nr:lamin tail domain-containing protein [Chloroflexaceae bacterium]